MLYQIQIMSSIMGTLFVKTHLLLWAFYFSYLTGGLSFWVREVKVTLDFNTRGTLRGYWSPEMANNPHSITCAVYHLVPISAPMVLTACYYQPKLLDSRPPWKKSRGWASGVVMSVGMTIVCLTQLRCTLYYNPKNHYVSIHLLTPFVVLLLSA